MSSKIKTITLLLALVCSTTACAQKPASKSHIQIQEERVQRCPEGQYAGPHDGARSFYQDPYVWFVSREFAQRFCMPESYIDDSLKGALALAVRLKNEEFTLCGFVGGPGSCPPKQKLLIDVYIDNRKVKIPKADPSVSYYSGVVQNSGWLAANVYDRKKNGGFAEVEGERRPFHPIGRSAQDGTVMFRYLGVREGWATGAGGLGESFYRADWIPGVDLITLDAYNFGYQGARNPDQQIQTERRGGRGYYDEEFDKSNPIKYWAIGVIKSSDFFEKYKTESKTIPYPSGYEHVIALPHKVAQIIYQYDWKQGEIFFNSVKNAIQPGSAPTK
ncbi:hypothetical protein [Limnohabitans sp.]|uniref:hypothetical protein n=1 Tax=Limnohabitans sp. TaxID=1907725 RepID=UPI0035B093B6